MKPATAVTALSVSPQAPPLQLKVLTQGARYLGCLRGVMQNQESLSSIHDLLPVFLRRQGSLVGGNWVLGVVFTDLVGHVVALGPDDRSLVSSARLLGRDIGDLQRNRVREQILTKRTPPSR